jgi:protoheme IX farnesyltransferase
MFTLIFMWTPPHFWALALFMKEDYQGRRADADGHAWPPGNAQAYPGLYAGAGPVSLAAALSSIGGPLSGGGRGAERWFLIGAWRIWRRDEAQAEADGYRVEKGFFGFSLLYLFLHFGGFLAEAALRPFGLGGW